MLEVVRVHAAPVVVAAVGVRAVGAVEHVKRERPDRVDVALPVRQKVRHEPQQVPRLEPRRSLEVPAQQLEPRGVVAGRLLERHAVARAVCEAQPEGVGLEPAVALPQPVGRPTVLVKLWRPDAGKQAAVLRERREEDREVVPARTRRGLPPRPGLAVERPALAPDRVRDSEQRQQVALVARIHVHRGVGEVPLAELDLHTAELRLEEALRDVRLGSFTAQSGAS